MTGEIRPQAGDVLPEPVSHDAMVGDSLSQVRSNAEIRQSLFGQLGPDGQISGVEEVSLVELARVNEARNVGKMPLAKGELTESVHAIITLPEGLEVLGLDVRSERDKDRLQGIGSITANTVWEWLRGIQYFKIKNKGSSLPVSTSLTEPPLGTEAVEEASFSERPVIQEVLVAAEAVNEVLDLGYKENSKDRLATFIAQNGPEYAKAWVSGKLIQDFCEEQGYDAQEYLDFINRANRLLMAQHHPSDPLIKARYIVTNHHDLVSYLSEITGVTIEEVKQNYTKTELLVEVKRQDFDLETAAANLIKFKLSGLRMHSAIQRFLDDLIRLGDDGIGRVIENYKRLSPDTIKRELGTSALSLVSEEDRVKLAFSEEDPIDVKRREFQNFTDNGT